MRVSSTLILYFLTVTYLASQDISNYVNSKFKYGIGLYAVTIPVPKIIQSRDEVNGPDFKTITVRSDAVSLEIYFGDNPQKIAEGDNLKKNDAGIVETTIGKHALIWESYSQGDSNFKFLIQVTFKGKVSIDQDTGEYVGVPSFSILAKFKTKDEINEFLKTIKSINFGEME